MIKPIITEQSMAHAVQGWYTFAVLTSTTKTGVKHEVEKRFSVTVTTVRTAIMHGKTRRVGKKMKTIRKSDWKKAFIRLKEGQKIDAFQITEGES